MCGVEYRLERGFPVFLVDEEESERSTTATEIVGAYDKIYSEHADVWVDQGRTDEFIRYFAAMLAEGDPKRLLEVGCGEGFLLAATCVADKYAVDVSTEALARAQQRSPAAHLSVSLAERLPFPDETFDVVASVGVMEHFLDDREATAEIMRVIKPGGRYVCLIHVDRNTAQKVRQKVSEFVIPPHPIRFVKWLVGKKALRPIHQPVQLDYTIESAQECIEGAGFRVEQVLHTGVDPTLPLIGPHVVVYDATKR